jgi:hypothetical protein
MKRPEMFKIYISPYGFALDDYNQFLEHFLRGRKEMKRLEIYKCPCGFSAYDYNQFLDHFLEHFVRYIELEIQYDQLRRELEGVKKT